MSAELNRGILEPIQRTTMNDKLFVSYYLTELCNFNCGYCYIYHPYGYRKVLRSIKKILKSRPRTHTKHELWRDIDTVVEHFRRTRKRVTFGFTGGEPIIYPHFIDICRRLAQEQRFMIALDTNLSVNAERFMDAVPPHKVEYICTALHVAERERIYGTLDAFRGAVVSLLERGYPVGVNYVMYPSLFDRVERDRRYFLEKGIRLDLKPFTGMHDGKFYPAAYTEEQLDFMAQRSTGPQDDDVRLRRFRGRRCNAGKSLIRIVANGNVVRCAGDHTSLGNIYTGFALHEEAQPCLLNRCPCFSVDRLFDDPNEKPAETPLDTLMRFRLMRARFVSWWEQ